MKITDHTDDMLIIDDKPWFAGLAMAGFGLAFGTLGVLIVIMVSLIGVVLIIIAAGTFYGFYRFIERSQVVFYRPSGTVEFRKKSMRRYQRDSYPLADIEAAHVNEQLTNSSVGIGVLLSQLCLIRKNNAGKLPFTTNYTSGAPYQDIANTINQWLAAG